MYKIYIGVAVSECIFYRVLNHDIGTKTSTRMGIDASLLIMGHCTETERSSVGPLMRHDVISLLCHHHYKGVKHQRCNKSPVASLQVQETELTCSVQQHRLAFVPMNRLPSGRPVKQFRALMLPVLCAIKTARSTWSSCRPITRGRPQRSQVDRTWRRFSCSTVGVRQKEAVRLRAKRGAKHREDEENAILIKL